MGILLILPPRGVEGTAESQNSPTVARSRLASGSRLRMRGRGWSPAGEGLGPHGGGVSMNN